MPTTGTTRGGCLPRSLRVYTPVLTRKMKNVQRELLLSSCGKSQNSQAARSGPVGPATDSRRPLRPAPQHSRSRLALRQFAVTA